MNNRIKKLITETVIPKVIKDLMQGFVYEFNDQDSEAWYDEVSETSSDYHCKELLKSGNCDFDNPSGTALTSGELMSLYNYYYFPIEFQSSYWLYNYLFKNGAKENVINKSFPIFIDINCKTGASFHAFNLLYFEISDNLENSKLFKRQNIELKRILNLAIDNSIRVIRKHAKDYYPGSSNLLYLIEKYTLFEYGFIQIDSGGDGYWTNQLNTYTQICLNDISQTINDFIENKGCLTEGKSEYPCWRDDNNEYIRSDNKALSYFVEKFEYPIIINLSYIFSQFKIDLQELLNFIIKLVLKFNNSDIIIIYQGIDFKNNNDLWDYLKAGLPLMSIYNGIAPFKAIGAKKIKFEVLYKSKFDDILRNYDLNFKKRQMR